MGRQRGGRQTLAYAKDQFSLFFMKHGECCWIVACSLYLEDYLSIICIFQQKIIFFYLISLVLHSLNTFLYTYIPFTHFSVQDHQCGGDIHPKLFCTFKTRVADSSKCLLFVSSLIYRFVGNQCNVYKNVNNRMPKRYTLKENWKINERLNCRQDKVERCFAIFLNFRMILQKFNFRIGQKLKMLLSPFFHLVVRKQI